MLLRIKHNVTFYHFRHNRKGGTKIAICSCGKRGKIFRRVHWKMQWRYLTRCLWLGHKWKDEYVDHGPAGFDENDPDVERINFRQCERCYKCETK